ncbi:MAG: zinc ABC transporter substrate-binding protein [Candidatus Magasanikbacteria bacterium]
MSKITGNKILIVILIIFIVGLFVCLLKINFSNQSAKVPATNLKLQVVTSFYPLYFFTTQIAQDKAEVHNITPSGAEPHDYEPTTMDMVKIENSQLLIINGGNFEGWANNVQNILGKQNTAIVNIGKSFVGPDPHFWLDPMMAKKEVEIITQNLIAIDPLNADFYANNSRLLTDKLEILNNQFKNELSNCQKKDIITAHAAFGYLAREYGLNQISISGLSPDAEPSTKKLTEIADYAKKNQLQYIFFESLVSPKLADTIAQEIGAKTLVLNPIEGITDEDIKNGKNYFTEMQNNLINLKIALQCQ